MKSEALVKGTKKHPSRSLEARRGGYGIGGGYEKPYRQREKGSADSNKHQYGALSHGGYYGAGSAGRPFSLGEATFGRETAWYHVQYGEKTSAYTESE